MLYLELVICEMLLKVWKMICFSIKGVSGLGDELEHFIYSLNIAKMFEATILVEGGLMAGSKIKHIGSSQYQDVAALLGIKSPVQLSFVENFYSPSHKLELSFSEALGLKKSLLNGTARLHCNTTIRSDISSCQGEWCSISLPNFDFIKNVASILKNNTARSTCREFGRGLNRVNYK